MSLIDDLSAIVGPVQVLTGPDMVQYSRDWMGEYQGAPP